jgi:hypothetical protein
MSALSPPTLSAVALFLPRVAYNAGSNLYASRWSVLPWTLFWFCAQAAAEALLPALFPALLGTDACPESVSTRLARSAGTPLLREMASAARFVFLLRAP